MRDGTSEFRRVPGEDLVDKSPLVHFNGFVASQLPLGMDL